MKFSNPLGPKEASKKKMSALSAIKPKLTIGNDLDLTVSRIGNITSPKKRKKWAVIAAHFTS
jgi:hypothetical protein